MSNYVVDREHTKKMCGYCQFFEADDENMNEGDQIIDVDGWCHRFPPKIDPANMDEYTMGAFPPVGGYTFCGEFKPFDD